MSSKILTILLLLFTTLTSFSQHLTIEAIYYDNTGNPYKIESKYSVNDDVTYLIHDNQGSYCVKRKNSFNGDTTIIKEESYRIFYEKSKLELFQECESWSVSSNMTGDTIRLRGYKMESSADTMILVGDTILTGETAKNSWEFSKRIKKARVPSIISGQLKIKTDSLILNETVIAYFLNGIPVKAEVFDSKNKLYSSSCVELSKNKMIWKRYFTNKEETPFQIDTISWNKDTTEITWHSSRIDDVLSNTITYYHINGTQLIIGFSDTSKKEIEYLDGRNIFHNILIGNFIYSDVLYYSELRHFDREQIVRASTQNQETQNRYIFDQQRRITEQLSYNKGQLQKRVNYKYEN